MALALDVSDRRPRATPTTICELARYPMMAAAFTSSWTAVSLSGLKLVDIFLLLALVPVFFDLLGGGRLPAAPSWLTFGAVGVVAVIVTHVVFPTSPAYLSPRFTGNNFFLVANKITEEGGITKGIQWLVALAAVPLLTSAVGRQRFHTIQSIGTAWLLGVVASSAVAVTDFLHLTTIHSSLAGWSDISGREAGLTVQPNNVGVSAAMAAPLAIWIASRRPLRGGSCSLFSQVAPWCPARVAVRPRWF
jgi:hypothetical protein